MKKNKEDAGFLSGLYLNRSVTRRFLSCRNSRHCREVSPPLESELMDCRRRTLIRLISCWIFSQDGAIFLSTIQERRLITLFPPRTAFDALFRQLLTTRYGVIICSAGMKDSGWTRRG